GQIYAMPFIPPIVQTEMGSVAEYAGGHDGACLFCYVLAEELRDPVRVVAQNLEFVALIPFAARFPAEIVIYPRKHVRDLTELDRTETLQLAEMISLVRQKYDNLYGFQLPLMMLVKQAPVKDVAPYHFHLQFLPLQRSATKLKYLASIETGFGT